MRSCGPIMALQNTAEKYHLRSHSSGSAKLKLYMTILFANTSRKCWRHQVCLYIPSGNEQKGNTLIILNLGKEHCGPRKLKLMNCRFHISEVATRKTRPQHEMRWNNKTTSGIFGQVGQA